LAWLSIWNAIEKPSIRFSNSGSTASGVTSRPVNGAAGGNDRIDAGIGDPAFDDDSDRIDVVDNDLARGQMMTGGRQPLRQRRARLVIRQRARVRDRQHRDVEGH
jgi:hypothetical protein